MATKKPTIKTFQGWLAESKKVSQEWRADSWRDAEMYDGGDNQWTQADWDAANEAGIEQITVNRTFPTIELLRGSHAISRFEITAKARTQKDSEVSQVMTEGIKFVSDQNDGEFAVSDAFKDALIPGFGCLGVTINNDPRKEKIKLGHRSWLEVGWDPFSSPWWKPESTRYVHSQKWMDMEHLTTMFPDKKKEIQAQFEEFNSDDGFLGYYESHQDYAQEYEEKRTMLIGRDWIDGDRKRVRPVEMWYPIFKACWFAVFPDGRVIELTDDRDGRETVQIVTAAQSVVTATVPKMQVCTFFGDQILQDISTPHSHDQFPFVPFVGYLDRYGFPFGVPRQIRGQDVEINKRRSMALALLNSQRVTAEQGAIPGGEEGLQTFYEEAQKLKGLMIVKEGKLNAVDVGSQGQLSAGQMALYEQSVQEINEISGSNDDRRGVESNATSGKAIEARQQAGAVISASLFENLRRSQKIQGQLIQSDIQGFWTEEKVLRITDRMTGAEKFLALNQHILGPDGRVLEVKNDVTQGKYDIIVSDAPQTDTIRERNLTLIQEVIKKSPPELAAPLLSLSFELMDLPNKEQLLAKIKPILGGSPADEDLSPEEVKQKVMEELQAQQEKAQQAEQMENAAKQLELENKNLENEKLKAEIDKIRSEAADSSLKADADWAKVGIELEKMAAGPTPPQPGPMEVPGSEAVQ